MGVGQREIGVAVHHLRGGLSDDEQALDDGLPGSLIVPEVGLAHTLGEGTRIRGLPHMVEVVGKAVPA